MARDRAARQGAKPLRLFVAVDIPTTVREALADAVAPVRDRVPGKWVPVQNWHVTMKFLGATYPRLVEWVMEQVGSVATRHAPVATSLAELGAFPNARRARVLWAGLDDASSFARIAGDLDDALAREFKREKRAFTAHLTVARFDPPVPVGGEIEGIEVPSEPFDVDRLVVYRSHLRRPAPVYEPVGEFHLGGR